MTAGSGSKVSIQETPPSGTKIDAVSLIISKMSSMSCAETPNVAVVKNWFLDIYVR